MTTLSQKVRDEVRRRIENKRKIPHRLTLRVTSSEVEGQIVIRFDDPYDLPIAWPLFLTLGKAEVAIAEWAARNGTTFRIEGEALNISGELPISSLIELTDLVQRSSDSEDLSWIDKA